MANKKWLGCMEDCFKCPYPDCYRPDNLCKTWDYDTGGDRRGKRLGTTRKTDLFNWDTTDSLLHKFLLRRLRDEMPSREL